MPRRWSMNNPNTPREAKYIGRPSKFGNPFEIGKNSWLREDVIRLYEEQLLALPFLDDFLSELRGKDVVCWCKPTQACHGDVLLRLANREIPPIKEASNGIL